MACAADHNSTEFPRQVCLREPHLYVAFDHFQPLRWCHLRITYSAAALHDASPIMERSEDRTCIVAEGQQVAGNPQEIRRHNWSRHRHVNSHPFSADSIDCQIKTKLSSTVRQLVLDEQVHEILGEFDLLS